jgi:archaellum component FlaC
MQDAIKTMSQTIDTLNKKINDMVLIENDNKNQFQAVEKEFTRQKEDIAEVKADVADVKKDIKMLASGHLELRKEFEICMQKNHDKK